jgi:hypothetical protein
VPCDLTRRKRYKFILNIRAGNPTEEREKWPPIRVNRQERSLLPRDISQELGVDRAFRGFAGLRAEEPRADVDDVAAADGGGDISAPLGAAVGVVFGASDDVRPIGTVQRDVEVELEGEKSANMREMILDCNLRRAAVDSSTRVFANSVIRAAFL